MGRPDSLIEKLEINEKTLTSIVSKMKDNIRTAKKH